MNIDNIMKDAYGVTGKKEKPEEKINRVFNPDRYIETFAELANSELKMKTLAMQYREKLTNYENKMKIAKRKGDREAYIAYSEGFSDIAKKVTNFGKDLWRTIKKLLGKLIIFLEEQIAYLFDRSKFVEKVLDKLSMVMRKLARWGIEDSSGIVSFRPSSGSDDSHILPYTLSSTVSIEWFKNRETISLKDVPNYDISSKDLFNYKTILPKLSAGNSGQSFENAVHDAFINEENTLLAIYKMTNFWKKNVMSNEKKLRYLAKDYKVAANVYKSTMKYVKGNSQGSTSSSNNNPLTDPYNGDTYATNVIDRGSPLRELGQDVLTSPTLKTQISAIDPTGRSSERNEYLYQFLFAGALMEVVVGLLERKNIRQKTSLNLNLISIRIDHDNYSEKLNRIYRDSEKLFIMLCIAMTNFKNMREVYFEYRKRANDLKNAPTEITDRYTKEVCQGVNFVISRSTKAAHMLLKSSKSTMMNYANYALHAVEVLDQLDKVLNGEHELDDRIIGN